MTDTTEAVKTEAPAEKPVKVAPAPKACLCSTFELYDPKDKDEVFAPECGLTTKSTFAQGHDARLVSFLVGGIKDGYSIRQVVDGKPVNFATPFDAVSPISTALGEKARTATENAAKKTAEKAEAKAKREEAKKVRQAEAEKKKADAAAAKTAKAAEKGEPKATGAEVVAGSAEGDARKLNPGEVRIKAGRWEYVATQNADGGVTWTDGKGEVQTRAEGDGYTVLETYTA